MIKKILLPLLLFLNSALHAEGKGNFFQTEAEIGLERSQLLGHIKIGPEHNSTKLDIKNDLGMKSSKEGLKAMLTRSTTHHKFGFKLEKYKHSGSKKLTSNILYNGASYADATLINSELSLKWAKAKYRYRYTKDFSIGIDLNGMRFKTIVNGDEVKKTILLPALGIDYERELEEGLNFISKASSTLIGESNYHYAYAGLSYDLKVLNCTCLHIGYQYKNLNIDTDNIDVALKYQGLYAGLAMEF